VCTNEHGSWEALETAISPAPLKHGALVRVRCTHATSEIERIQIEITEASKFHGLAPDVHFSTIISCSNFYSPSLWDHTCPPFLYLGSSLYQIFYKCDLMAFSNADGFAPTTSPTFSPSLNSMNVGMARTLSSCATSGTSSTSSL
jgi:hypothetical protein